MYIVGITGPTGAGKTIAAKALEKIGALALDCDEVYHELLGTDEEMITQLLARFPEAAAGGADKAGGTDRTDGKQKSSASGNSKAIDRRKLSSIVFNSPDALRDLNQITHKHVLREIDRRIARFEAGGGAIASVNAIALIEVGFAKKCDTVICITAPQDMRRQRIMERDGITFDEATVRINAQKPESFYIEGCDYTLFNDKADTSELESACVQTVLIDKWIGEHADEMLGDLAQLVKINSVRGKSLISAPFGEKPREALQAAQNMLERHGFEVDVFKDMVISASYGPKPEQLGILTHLDIVEAGEHWDTDPFTLTVKDGKILGRGAMDNKSPAVASMYALYCIRELFPQLRRGVRLIFGSGEETGFDDIAQYEQHCKESKGLHPMPPYVFSPDSEYPVVNTEKGRFMPVFGAKWEKDGTLPRVVSITGGKTPNIVPNTATAVVEGIDLEMAQTYCKEFADKTGICFTAAAAGKETALAITAKGTAAHASRPHLGNNAQTALLAMLAEMPFAESRAFDCVKALARLFPHGDHYGNALGVAMQDDLSGKTTVNFGVLRLDELEFSACFDARTAVCADKSDLLGAVQNTLQNEGFEITYHELKASHHVPEGGEFVQALLKTYERCTGKPGRCLCVGGLTYVHDIEGGVAFGCIAPGCPDDNNLHAANEYITADELLKNAKIFATAILQLCG